LHPIDTLLARLGSRGCFHFRPRECLTLFSPIGKYYDRPLGLKAGIRVGSEEWMLPMGGAKGLFEFVEEELTLTSLSFRGFDPKAGVRLRVKFTSPFYPGDARLSIAPMIFIELEVSKIWQNETTPSEGEAFLRLDDENLNASERGLYWEKVYSFNYGMRNQFPWPNPSIIPKEEDSFSRGLFRFEHALVANDEDLKVARNEIVLPFSIKGRELAKGRVIFAVFSSEPVLIVREEPYRFKYLEFFHSLDEVIEYARRDGERITDRTNLFDSLLLDSSLGKAKQDLLAIAFQSYLYNTWWVMSSEGKEWFHVWEGNCMYISTLDVAYHLSIFPLLFWPGLLKMELDEWPMVLEKEGYLAHDMGQFLRQERASYHHPMPVEENTNYILLSFAYWRMTGDDGLVRKHFATLKRLTEFIIECDSTGDGVPDRGTVNTVDDASAAVQFAKKQTYLGIKVLASYRAMELIADLVGEKDFAGKCRGLRELLLTTLDKSFREDHWPVCLVESARGLKDPWTGKALTDEQIEGWDAYSLWNTHGLLYLLVTGTDTGLDEEKVRRDILSSTQKSLTEYGCTHSSADRKVAWISANLWRDATAAYFGIDLLDMMERYWAFEVYENTFGREGGFVETCGLNWLSFYPRGVDGFAMLPALLGMRLDASKKKIILKPVRAPLRLPLVALADWRREKVPWVSVKVHDGKISVDIEGQDALKDWDVEIRGD